MRLLTGTSDSKVVVAFRKLSLLSLALLSRALLSLITKMTTSCFSKCQQYMHDFGAWLYMVNMVKILRLYIFKQFVLQFKALDPK